MINVFDNNLNLIGFLEDFDSFQYSIRFNKAGDFNITGLLTDATRKYLQLGNYIQYEDFAGPIESVMISLDEEGIERIEAAGPDLSGLLGFRYVIDTYTASTNAVNVEDFIRERMNKNAIAASTAARNFPQLVLGADNGFTEKLVIPQQKNINLLTSIENLCGQVDYGFRTRFDIPNKKFVFELYKPEEVNVIVGRDFDNVLIQDLTSSYAEMITTTHYGSTWGGDNTAAGYFRREAVVADKAGSDAAINPKVEVYDCDLLSETLQVGQVVICRDKKWGLTTTARINEKQVAVETIGKTTTYIIGNDTKGK